MPFINEIFKHKDFFVYELDTPNSVINRLASEMNTIPKFLYFTEGIPSLKKLHEDQPIEVENLLNTIITTDKEFVELINELNEENKLKQQNLHVLDIIS